MSFQKLPFLFSVGKDFEQQEDPFRVGGLAAAFKIHPPLKLTASWSLQIGQAPTGHDMVFKPSILKCKLAVCFREGTPIFGEGIQFDLFFQLD